MNFAQINHFSKPHPTEKTVTDETPDEKKTIKREKSPEPQKEKSPQKVV